LKTLLNAPRTDPATGTTMRVALRTRAASGWMWKRKSCSQDVREPSPSGTSAITATYTSSTDPGYVLKNVRGSDVPEKTFDRRSCP